MMIQAKNGKDETGDELQNMKRRCAQQ